MGAYHAESNKTNFPIVIIVSFIPSIGYVLHLWLTRKSLTTASVLFAAKRTNKQVFVGGSLSYNQLMLPLIEKRIGEEIKAHPEIFIN